LEIALTEFTTTSHETDDLLRSRIAWMVKEAEKFYLSPQTRLSGSMEAWICFRTRLPLQPLDIRFLFGTGFFPGLDWILLKNGEPPLSSLHPHYLCLCTATYWCLISEVEMNSTTEHV
jgi:hypothetical protein